MRQQQVGRRSEYAVVRWCYGAAIVNQRARDAVIVCPCLPNGPRIVAVPLFPCLESVQNVRRVDWFRPKPAHNGPACGRRYRLWESPAQPALGGSRGGPLGGTLGVAASLRRAPKRASGGHRAPCGHQRGSSGGKSWSPLLVIFARIGSCIEHGRGELSCAPTRRLLFTHKCPKLETSGPRRPRSSKANSASSRPQRFWLKLSETGGR